MHLSKEGVTKRESMIYMTAYFSISLATIYSIWNFGRSNIMNEIATEMTSGCEQGNSILNNAIKSVYLVSHKYFTSNPLHFWWIELWIMPCISIFFFQTIELDRYGLCLVPLYSVFCHIISIGVFWPLIMTYYAWKRRRLDRPLVGGCTLPRVCISGASAGLMVITASALSTVSTNGTIFVVLLYGFLVASTCIPIIAFLIPRENSPHSVVQRFYGQRFANLCYAFLAGMSFLMYWRNNFPLIEYYFSDSWKLGIQKITSEFMDHEIHYLFLCNCVSSLLTLLVWICMDGGILKCLFFVVASLLISPGTAISIYILRRESLFYAFTKNNYKYF